ncbi:hypothetical protein AUP68_08917 [Ilyonectria robusta]
MSISPASSYWELPQRRPGEEEHSPHESSTSLIPLTDRGPEVNDHRHSGDDRDANDEHDTSEPNHHRITENDWEMSDFALTPSITLTLNPPSERGDQVSARGPLLMTEPDNTEPGQPDKKAGGNFDKNSQSTLRIWFLEIMSILFALGCLIAIVIVLTVHQNNPLPSRPELLSINSLISVFTTFFKAALIMPVAEGLGQLKWTWFTKPHKLSDVSLFDEASRGPWGSFFLLLKQVARSDKAYLASFGALITIAALAIDPFSQALVEHVVCRREVKSSVARAARTNNYTASVPGFKYSQMNQRPGLDKTMRSALYRGLIDPGSAASQIDFDCARGNCTFGAEGDGGYFSSLAMCHSCTDISDDIFIPGKKNATNTFSLPSNLQVYNQSPLSAARVDFNSSFYSFEALMHKLPPGCEKDEYECIMRENMDAFAVRCTLDPCVKKYSAQVTNQEYIEFEEDQGSPPLLRRNWIDDVWINGLRAAYSLISNYSLVDGLSTKCNSSIDSIPRGVLVNSRTHLLNDKPESYVNNKSEWVYYPPECVWVIDLTPYYAITGTLDDLLGDEVRTDGRSGFDQVIGPVWLTTLYADGMSNLTMAEQMTKGIASSMTAAMRNHPFTEGFSDVSTVRRWDINRNLTTVNGMGFAVDTCVRVHWGWIAYPAALLLLQLLFCTFVLLTINRKAGPGEARVPTDWKTSPLAPLFHGLDEDLRQKSGGLTSAKMMDDAAEKIDVQLCKVDTLSPQGWRLFKS